MRQDIQTKIQSMTNEEVREQLAKYMSADTSLMPKTTAIEVLRQESFSARCRYDVLLVDEEGHKTPVAFPDRISRLIYIFTLLHPQGYQRRAAAANNCQPLQRLYNLLYMKDSKALMKSIERTGFDQFFSHHVGRSRMAIRLATPHHANLIIDYPQKHNGKELIPFVATGGTVTIDQSLRNNMSNF